MNITNFERKLEYCLNKLDKQIDLDWIEIRDELGLDCSPDHLRKTAYGLLEYHNYIQDKGIDSISNDMYDKLLEKEIEIKKLMTKLTDMRTLVNKETREQARYEQLLDMLSDAISNIKVQMNTSIKEVKSGRRECIMTLADLHYGLEIDSNWNVYNSNIATQRMNMLVDRTIEIGKRHDCNIVHVAILGDLCNGDIHLTSRLSNRETITQQVVGVSELICQAIGRLYSSFSYVVIHLTSGNHDRILPGKGDNGYEDNYINIIKEFMRIRLKNLDNIIFNENENGHDIASFNICNKKVVAMHGDKIPFKQMIPRLTTMYGQVDYVLRGHVHNESAESFGNSKVVTVSSFSGQDSYARQLGYYNNPSQKVIVLENGSNDEVIYNIDLSGR